PLHRPPSCFFPHTAPTLFYTLSLHDALPIYYQNTLLETSPTESVVRAPTYYTPSNDQPYQYSAPIVNNTAPSAIVNCDGAGCWGDRKSTRLNSSHVSISYAVFCLKKKTQLRV